MSDRYLCKAKDKDDGEWYEGYYLQLHDTTYCCMPSDNTAEAKRLNEENTHHYIVFEQMTDWGLPNKHLRAEILPETLCQYAGLTDKRIWENDICQWFDNDYSFKCTGIVRFGEFLQDGSSGEYDAIPCYGFYVEVIKYEPYPDGFSYPEYLKTISILELFNSEKKSDVKFIGNAFDNLELLGGGAE